MLFQNSFKVCKNTKLHTVFLPQSIFFSKFNLQHITLKKSISLTLQTFALFLSCPEKKKPKIMSVESGTCTVIKMLNLVFILRFNTAYFSRAKIIKTLSQISFTYAQNIPFHCLLC